MVYSAPVADRDRVDNVTAPGVIYVHQSRRWPGEHSAFIDIHRDVQTTFRVDIDMSIN